MPNRQLVERGTRYRDEARAARRLAELRRAPTRPVSSATSTWSQSSTSRSARPSKSSNACEPSSRTP